MFVPEPKRQKIKVDIKGNVQYQGSLTNHGYLLGALAYLSLSVITFLLLAQAIAAATPDTYVVPACTPGYYRACEVPNPDGTFERVYYDAHGLQTVHAARRDSCK